LTAQASETIDNLLLTKLIKVFFKRKVR